MARSQSSCVKEDCDQRCAYDERAGKQKSDVYFTRVYRMERRKPRKRGGEPDQHWQDNQSRRDKQCLPNEWHDDVPKNSPSAATVHACSICTITGRIGESVPKHNNAECRNDPVDEPEGIKRDVPVKPEEGDGLRNEPDLPANDDREKNRESSAITPTQLGHRIREKRVAQERNSEIRGYENCPGHDLA